MSSLHLVYSTNALNQLETICSPEDTLVLMSSAVLLTDDYQSPNRILSHEVAAKARNLSTNRELINTEGLVTLSTSHARVITWP